jgi:hypothetical protein
MDQAVTLAVKTLDSLLPPLIGLPIYLLARRWPGASQLTALSAAAAASCGFHSLMLLGDFEKNALALVFMAWLAWGIHEWLCGPRLRSLLGVVGLSGLLGLTHVGTLGASCGFAGLATVVALVVLKDKAQRWSLLKLVLLSGGLLALAVGLVYKIYDPERAVRLVSALTDPATIQTSKHPIPNIMPSGPDIPGPSGGRGGMLGVLPYLRHALAGLFIIVGLTALWQGWQRRQLLQPADQAIIISTVGSMIFLGGPWWDMDKGFRFNLIAAVFACITFSWCAAASSRQWQRGLCNACLLFYAAASICLYPLRGGRAMIHEGSMDELASLKNKIPQPEHSLVVARHGLEWWVAWTLHTHIAQPSAIAAEDWDKYAGIYYLTENKPMMPFGGGPPGKKSSGGEQFRPMGFMRGPQHPSNAAIIHTGEHYKLSHAKILPENLRPMDFLEPWW